MTQKKLKMIKGLVIVAMVFAITLFVTGTIQTFKLQSLKNQTNKVESEISQVEKDIEYLEKEIEFKESEEYKEEYFHSNNEKTEDETIFVQK